MLGLPCSQGDQILQGAHAFWTSVSLFLECKVRKDVLLEHFQVETSVILVSHGNISCFFFL